MDNINKLADIINDSNRSGDHFTFREVTEIAVRSYNFGLESMGKGIINRAKSNSDKE